MIRRIVLAVALLAAPAIIVAQTAAPVQSQQTDSTKAKKKARKHAGKKHAAKPGAADTTAPAKP
jgi:hypothetical protein